MDIEGPPPFSGSFEEATDVKGTVHAFEEDDDDPVENGFELDHLPIPSQDLVFSPPSPISSNQSVKQVHSSVVNKTSCLQNSNTVNEDINEDAVLHKMSKENCISETCNGKNTSNPKTVVITEHPVDEQPSQQVKDEAKLDPSPPTDLEEPSTEDNEMSKESVAVENDFASFTSFSKEEPAQKQTQDTVVPNSSSEEVAQNYEDADDFGDFADFAAAEPSSTMVEDDSEWGDFDAAPRTSCRSISTHKDSEEDDGFGAFGAASSEVATTTEEAEDDWAADFQQAPPPQHVPQFEDFEVQKDYPSIETMDTTTIWELEEDSDCEENGDDVIFITSEFDQNSVKETNLNAEGLFYKSAEIWHSIRIVEDSKALEFAWDTSVTDKNFLKRLGIDQNATRMSVQPLSVNNILQPTPVTSGIPSISTPGVSEPTVLPASGTLTPTSITEYGSNKENGNSPIRGTTPERGTTPISMDSLSAPPADFDWNKSGLTNPLKGGNRSSALLDVDFLSLNSGNTLNSVSTLQKDLDAFGLSTPSETISTSQQSVLDKILASSVSAPKHNYKQSAELSLDAGALHGRLPEIGYLRSKTIMFPIGVINPPQDP